MKSRNVLLCLVFALLAGASTDLLAQRKEKIRYRAAGTLVGGRLNGRPYQKLTTDVIFTQENTVIYCDSAFLYNRDNVLEAFGHVRIVDNDTVTITGRKLVYDGNARKAEMRQNVVYTSGSNRLYTDYLDYELDTKIAYYFNNGRLVDPNNTLSSRQGYFYSDQHRANFYGSVELLSPEYTLHADTLLYNTITKIAVTRGRTEIITSDSTFLYSDGGEFKTIPEQSSFVKGQIETRDYILEGDELFFDDQNKYYTATGHVKMTAKNNDVIITGEKGIYWRTKGVSKIFGNPVMKKVMEADTFYLAADTLVSIEDKIDSLKRILAYNNVRMFRSNLQGRADSLAYFIADSSITFYFDPILWNLSNQINSDTIHLYLENNVIDQMYLQKNAFIVAQDTMKHFNQVKGREMRAFFENNFIKRVNVDGNGESIYYVLSEGDSVLLGMNRILCSNLAMRFEENELANISFYVRPEATFYPPHEITEELTKLEGFSWRSDERPGLADVLNPPAARAGSDTVAIKKRAAPKSKAIKSSTRQGVPGPVPSGKRKEGAPQEKNPAKGNLPRGNGVINPKNDDQ